MAASRNAPVPPVALPPARTVLLPGRGELFVRDSGGDGPPLLLLHGWTATADLNWYGQYDALVRAGHRVLALDHRGHGRGMRALAEFALADCADDALGVLDALGTGPATLVGYSMGGPIALLAAHRRPDAVRALALCATSSSWRSPRVRGLWWSMAGFRLLLAVAPYGFWRAGLRLAGLRDDAQTTWATGELVRGSARDIAEGGRELGRFDARPWIGELRAPAAVVLTREDRAVPPRWQRALAAQLGAPVFESPGDHLASATHTPGFNRALLAALGHLDQVVSNPPSTGRTAPVT